MNFRVQCTPLFPHLTLEPFYGGMGHANNCLMTVDGIGQASVLPANPQAISRCVPESARMCEKVADADRQAGRQIYDQMQKCWRNRCAMRKRIIGETRRVMGRAGRLREK